MSDEALAGEPDDTLSIEDAVDAAIQACDGDLRATIRALILANAFLEREVANSVSAGFVRRRKLQA